MTPSIFIGIGFGRLGCLLYSCCYGDPTTLPWGIEFPHGSVAFDAYVQRGLVSPNAPLCIPLHPTQVYSSINGFILAAVTIAYFPYRRHPGQVFSLGMILYAITRFAIEIVRSDEEGQLGTPLTISQLLCLAMLAAGIWLAVHLSRQPRSTEKS
ncbi:MAG: prolipoprotein diacylglyceryl transferase [Planctomycetaceae bacterium]